MGYAVRPAVPKTRNKVGPEPPPGAGNVQGVAPTAPPPGAGAPGGGAPGGGRGGRGGRGGGPAKPVEMNVFVNPKGGVEEDYPLHAHTRNFLDCIKDRKKPNASLEIGYNSALPCLLALEAMKAKRVMRWDAAAKKAVAI
jgi:hypothetical protein